VTDLVTAFGLIALAELGDKSQLLALTFATRYRWWQVLVGIVVAEALLLGTAAGLGGLLGTALPERAIAAVSGVVFLGFAVWTFSGDDGDDGDELLERPTPSRRSVLVTVVLAFIVAELGDKTMLASAALASTRSPVAVWIGGVAGVTVASGAAIVVGSLLGRRLPAHRLRLVSAVAFAVFGVLLLEAASG
jgi:putative Ca2+/H+ antiporter (TMEM165/GDT1 family)